MKPTLISVLGIGALVLVTGIVIFSTSTISERIPPPIGVTPNANTNVPSAPKIIPCDGKPPASTLEVSRQTQTSFDFISAGGDVFFTVKNIQRLAVLDVYPNAEVRIGKGSLNSQKEFSELPPAYIERKTSITFVLHENEYSKAELEPGHYWIWFSNGVGEILSCTPNSITEVKP